MASMTDRSWPDDPERARQSIRAVVDEVLPADDVAAVDIGWVTRPPSPIDADPLEEAALEVRVRTSATTFETQVWGTRWQMTWQESLAHLRHSLLDCFDGSGPQSNPGHADPADALCGLCDTQHAATTATIVYTDGDPVAFAPALPVCDTCVAALVDNRPDDLAARLAPWYTDFGSTHDVASLAVRRFIAARPPG